MNIDAASDIPPVGSYAEQSEALDRWSWTATRGTPVGDQPAGAGDGDTWGSRRRVAVPGARALLDPWRSGGRLREGCPACRHGRVGGA